MNQMASLPLVFLSTVLLVLTGISLLRSRNPQTAWRIALTCSMMVALAFLYVFSTLEFGNSELHFPEQAGSGILAWRVGIDRLNMPFLLLLTLLTPVLLVYLRNATEIRQLAGILLYEGLLLAALSSQGVLLFWGLLLIEYLPLRLLMTPKPEASVLKTVSWYRNLMLVLLLAGILLYEQYNDSLPALSLVLLFFGFAARMPAFPFHGWLPLLISRGNLPVVFCFIAGIKTGIYGMVRFVLPMAADHSSWIDFFQWLGLCGIFYGALMALMQINLNRLLAYAIISQNGMLLTGIFTFNDYGLIGSILLSNAFGLGAAGMIISIGFIRRKTGTVFIPRLGSLFENNASPALLFFLAALSTMAIPGTPGYNAAHLLLEGVITESGWLTATAILIGNVLAAAFLLRAFQQIFIADSRHLTRRHAGTRVGYRDELLVSLALCLLLLIAGFSPLADILGVRI